MNFGEKVELIQRCIRMVRFHLGEKAVTSSGVQTIEYENLEVVWANGWHDVAELVLAVKKGPGYVKDAPPDKIFTTQVALPSFKFSVSWTTWHDEKRGEALLAMMRHKMILDDLASI